MSSKTNQDSTQQPGLPEGVGMALQDARSLLEAQHGSRVSADDPVLMLVTLHNAFLKDYEQLLARHHQALTGLFAEKGAAYLAEVGRASDVIGKELSAASVKSIRETFQAHGQALQRFRRDITWLTAIVMTAALVNVAALAWLGPR